MNSRRAAAFVVARWIATHGHLSEMLPDGPDRAFVQDLAYTTVRRFRALRSVLGKLVTKWPKGEMEALLLAGVENRAIGVVFKTGIADGQNSDVADRFITGVGDKKSLSAVIGSSDGQG